MNTLINCLPIFGFIAAFIFILVKAIRDQGEGVASNGTHQFSDLPANNINGLPMVGGVDVMGNPYGTTHDI